MPSSQFVKIVNGDPTIDIGAMKHMVTIQQEVSASPPTFDEAGAELSPWTTFTTGWAAIDTVRGTDVIKAGLTTTQLFLVVAMWWQAGILPKMRVLNDNGSVYVIQSVENILEADVVLVLNCLGIGANE